MTEMAVATDQKWLSRLSQLLYSTVAVAGAGGRSLLEPIGEPFEIKPVWSPPERPATAIFATAIFDPVKETR